MEQMLNSDNIIAQSVLRELEALCIQEEPPACTAACPLHLDVRGLMSLVREGNFADAFKLYQKTIPFAGLVARTCDAPCQKVCLREKLGGAIQIQRIEEAVAREAGKPAKPPFALSDKGKKIAIVGGGLRGMTAADFLGRKGYQSTIFEGADALGGWLRSLPEDILPPAVLEGEIKALLALPVTVEYGRRIEEEEAAALLDSGFDAVYLACSSRWDEAADPDSLLTEIPGLLAGRRGGRRTEGNSSIGDVFDGRSAALSIDRLMQGVSVTVGREREGGAETRLYTSLEGVEPSPAVAPGEGGYSREQAVREAERCIGCQCLECVKKCAFLRHYKGYPRRYVREVYNNLSIAMGNHDANGMINACALCGQCGEVCPQGLDMSQVFLAARQRMVKTGKMPQSAHEFALLDMDYSLSDAFFLARHQPGHETSRAVFFPGCQLAASEPELVTAAYRDLSSRLEGGLGLLLGCCGVMAHWAGNAEREAAAGEQLAKALEQLGNPKVIAGCPTCAKHLHAFYGIETESVFEALAVIDPKANGSTPAKMRLHHACGARHDGVTQKAVADLAGQLGLSLSPGAAREEEAPCCGYGGLVPFSNREVAGALTETALDGLGDGEEPVLTYCVNCRDRYLASGGEAYHLLELLYPDVTGLRRKNPTWSERQENRAALKRTLQRELWGESPEERKEMELYIDKELEEKLERSHILHSNLAAAIGRAEETGEKLVAPQSGRYTASHRPGNVTFWVEYSPQGEGWRVHNAYSHRMDCIVTDKLSESGAGDRG